METKISLNSWNNTHINSLTKQTLQKIKRLCVLNFGLSCLVFCLGCVWFGLSIYNLVKNPENSDQFKKTQFFCNWFLLSSLLVNAIPTSIGIKIFIDIKNLANWNIRNLFFDLGLCNFILQFFSLFGGIICSSFIYKKVNILLNNQVIIENKTIYTNNYNTVKNKIITNFKYSFISQPSLDCNIKLIKLDSQNKEILFHIFSIEHFYKITVKIPQLYSIWPIKIETNLLPIVQHIYLDPEQKIIKINYIAHQKTCFENQANFYESIIVLPF